MALRKEHCTTLHTLLLEAYSDVEDFDLAVSLRLGLKLNDLAAQGKRPKVYRDAIDALDDMGRIPDLIRAIVEDRPTNAPLLDRLADLFNAIGNEGLNDIPHQQLLVHNVAFVNRDNLRTLISGVVANGSPRVLLLRGRGFAGASHCRYLIQHVAHAKGGIDAVWLDLDKVLERTPPEVMKALALRAGLGIPPGRNDLIGADGALDSAAAQLKAGLCNWFVGKTQERYLRTGRGLWLLIDNAHRDTVPAPTREMVADLIEIVDAGMVEGLHLFVLGAEATMPVVLPFTVEQQDITPLGRPDIATFLASVLQRHGSLDEYMTVDAATDAILATCDLDQPDLLALRSMTAGLTELVRRVVH